MKVKLSRVDAALVLAVIGIALAIISSLVGDIAFLYWSSAILCTVAVLLVITENTR